MISTRPPKKSETIEIRLSHTAKSAFVEHCRHEQRSASEVLRLLIDERIDPVSRARSRRLPRWPIAAAGIAGALFGIGAAAPSLARATQNNCASFDQMDRNHDGVVGREELGSR
jgi:hypothetical protein